MDNMPCCNDEICDPFSKFAFTSDVELSVRKAMSDLDGLLARADSGLVNDLEKLPYVCAAMEQLEQRKKYWNDHPACESNRSCKISDSQAASHVYASTAYATHTDYEACGFGRGTLSTDVNEQIEWLVILYRISQMEGLGWIKQLMRMNCWKGKTHFYLLHMMKRVCKGTRMTLEMQTTTIRTISTRLLIFSYPFLLPLFSNFI
jgi:hypothetical protein